MNIIPVVLSGGQGMRLWPLSRQDKPKQFLNLANLSSGRSLFEQALLRCRRRIFDNRPIVVGAIDHRFLIGETLANSDCKADVILEPVARDTCAAIVAACLQAIERNSEALVLVMAADHDITDAAAFTRSVEQAHPSAKSGRLVTFGVRPDAPDPNYGFIAPGAPDGECFSISGFVEKPERGRACEMVNGGWLWNSGNFLFRADVALQQINHHQPEILNAVTAAFHNRDIDHDFVWLEKSNYQFCPKISFDYGVMEKTGDAVVLPVDYKWTDVGNWNGFANLGETDECGNAVFGDFINRDSRNNVVHSEGKYTALLGIENLVVVSTDDAVLVANRERSDEIKSLVADLAQQDHRMLESKNILRPWGIFEQLDLAEDFHVKRLNVKPGAELSLQKHARRAEHWVVVKGVAEVTINDHKTTCRTDNSIYIPKGATHRLANPGSSTLIVIEIQTGDYFGEDDLVRLEDRYDRCNEGASRNPDEPDLAPLGVVDEV